MSKSDPAWFIVFLWNIERLYTESSVHICVPTCALILPYATAGYLFLTVMCVSHLCQYLVLSSTWTSWFRCTFAESLGRTPTIFKLGSDTSPFHKPTIRRDIGFVRDIFTAGETSKERGVSGKRGT